MHEALKIWSIDEYASLSLVGALEKECDAFMRWMRRTRNNHPLINLQINFLLVVFEVQIRSLIEFDQGGRDLADWHLDPGQMYSAKLSRPLIFILRLFAISNPNKIVKLRRSETFRSGFFSIRTMTHTWKSSDSIVRCFHSRVGSKQKIVCNQLYLDEMLSGSICVRSGAIMRLIADLCLERNAKYLDG